jgi:hypothetical protein
MVRHEILEEHGVVEWAVEMIRDARDERGTGTFGASPRFAAALDESVAIRWVNVEPDSNKATGVREDHRNAIHDLIAPESAARIARNRMPRAGTRGKALPKKGFVASSDRLMRFSSPGSLHPGPALAFSRRLAGCNIH